MPQALKYIVDEKGKRIFVLVPIKVWEKLNVNYRKTQRKLEILAGINDGLKEVEEAKKTGKKLQTLNSYLQEFCIMKNN